MKRWQRIKAFRRKNRRYALYSPSAARDFGFTLWRGDDGREIQCTCVCSTKSEARDFYKWPDSICVGRVNGLKSFIRRASDGIYGSLFSVAPVYKPEDDVMVRIFWPAVVAMPNCLPRITTC